MDNLPTMDKLLAAYLYIVHTFLPPNKGQPLNNGQNACPQCVHYSEVPLYTLSKQSLTMHIHMCLLFVFVRNAECLMNESLLAIS